ncbi:MAG: 5-methyltetrahydropteroyltriglutamate--homocysteine methyltransferase [Nitrospinota bacterium]|nr:5-methyltetrahydropteroyltriglutamate--homocysteine methyltransferase [Nitrospinota bacterium]MDP7369270.1 5-methyltetrahydropteroyltriglutamate--homocysteine methyltransferase [Nitrospinota bacterium]MDP7502499.1 5-methyltetrahydropteroyltriglutamate--homocysteine methyltransferase [Nitrospinota bacterium]MDP7663913.1 5-methyltetrahydropteroyltriglutamate--homocysteine methyltransferase [Nitrospinota bacterium]HJP14752.1 5-methyltetrahydropteroyltriglutamate--homocysteine methyltransferase 
MTKAFATTVIGSMPKPPWLLERRAMNDPAADHHGKGADWLPAPDLLPQAQDDACRLAIHDQERAGIDIISDGEQRRKSYLTYITMQLSGIDYGRTVPKLARNGRRTIQAGRVTGPIRREGPLLKDDLLFLMREAAAPVKITLPGPMTVWDTVADEHYGDARALALDYAAAINGEARELDALGPAVIQFDEPVFSRYPALVAEWGNEALDRCLEGLAARTAVHVCYSYPMPGVARPIQDSYPVILEELEKSRADCLALEFEASGLDPSLLRLCPSKTVIFGCIDNGSETPETPEHVARKLLAAAEHHPPEKIQAAPDCGLVPLGRESACAKLDALVRGARIARERVAGGTE